MGLERGSRGNEMDELRKVEGEGLGLGGVGGGWGVDVHVEGLHGKVYHNLLHTKSQSMEEVTGQWYNMVLNPFV